MENYANLIKLIRSRGKTFKKDTDGAVSVEFVLWMPLFMVIIMLIADTSVFFTSQSNYWSVARDTARLASRHALTESAAEIYATQQATSLWGAPTADVIMNGSTVTVNLSAPASSISIFNTLTFFTDGNLNASITQSMEPT